MTGAELQAAYAAGRRDFREANLAKADLRGADLRGAYLREANLTKANLAGANLAKADLRGADLRGANLTEANLTRADLTGAYLTKADLAGANLTEADLTSTCLDPALVLPDATDALRAVGLTVRDGVVYAYRTARSQHVGSTDYRRPGVYRASWFSGDRDTPCHPGIYLAALDWLRREYGPDVALVGVTARVADCLVTASGKVRAREIRVHGVLGSGA